MTSVTETGGVSVEFVTIEVEDSDPGFSVVVSTTDDNGTLSGIEVVAHDGESDPVPASNDNTA
jgi:hypothetical protein